MLFFSIWKNISFSSLWFPLFFGKATCLPSCCCTEYTYFHPPGCFYSISLRFSEVPLGHTVVRFFVFIHHRICWASELLVWWPTGSIGKFALIFCSSTSLSLLLWTRLCHTRLLDIICLWHDLSRFFLCFSESFLLIYFSVHWLFCFVQHVLNQLNVSLILVIIVFFSF